jgi:hypothetical protein
MAVGIDCMLISVALALLTADPEANKDISAVAYCKEAGAPVMSDGAHWAQIAFRLLGAISGATFVLAS